MENKCLWEVQKDDEKTWLSSKDPNMFAFTVKRLDMECKNHCDDYATCKETKDKLARLLARNISNMNGVRECTRRQFCDDRFNFSDDR